MGFETKRIASAPDAIAPDGSEVRVLCQLSRGGLTIFSLPPNAVSKAVAHRTVEEVWYTLSGKGRMLGDQEEIAEPFAFASARPRAVRFENAAAFELRRDAQHGKDKLSKI